MEAKIKIKIDKIEIEYEGTEKYLKEELPKLIENLMEYYPVDENKIEDIEDEELAQESSGPKKEKVQLTINSIASKLNVKKGPELVLATCAYLHFIEGVDTFSRDKIVAEMKQANNYYKETHLKNLSQNIKNLISSDKIIERKQGVYALDARILPQMKEKLG